MIKLKLTDKPKELTSEKEKELTEKFKVDGSSVWRKPYIIKALLEISNGKCAYSEQRLNKESAYLEVEHFKHKDKYKGDVVKWGNLLPSCKKCNVQKSAWDVEEKPIVHPYYDNPKDYLYVTGFRFYGKNEMGNNTIKAVGINDRDHFVNPRSEIGQNIDDQLTDKLSILNSCDETEQHVQLKRIKRLLKGCGPAHVYSAVLSTFVLYESSAYKLLEQYLKNNQLWDEEFELITKELRDVSLPNPTIVP